MKYILTTYKSEQENRHEQNTDRKRGRGGRERLSTLDSITSPKERNASPRPRSSVAQARPPTKQRYSASEAMESSSRRRRRRVLVETKLRVEEESAAAAEEEGNLMVKGG
mgnify:CR=1 FL=1